MSKISHNNMKGLRYVTLEMSPMLNHFSLSVLKKMQHTSPVRKICIKCKKNLQEKNKRCSVCIEETSK